MKSGGQRKHDRPGSVTWTDEHGCRDQKDGNLLAISVHDSISVRISFQKHPHHLENNRNPRTCHGIESNVENAHSIMPSRSVSLGISAYGGVLHPTTLRNDPGLLRHLPHCDSCFVHIIKVDHRSMITR